MNKKRLPYKATFFVAQVSRKWIATLPLDKR